MFCVQGIPVKAALSRDQNVESTLKANDRIPVIYQQSLLDLMTKLNGLSDKMDMTKFN